ncbi:hypothetical protein FEM48_Zijuj12G0093900 [Ziziphus jujuba var. spinosa]|uniref:Remorin C-terminal domain-containing protein n=1 Tax=Ziziphus jujuba var. spinosa TaxID=714518 RepID=A0A978UCH5_ZIZJJ|nr:hypothetical protein FEM48_Zijuj12G0093900 [Ziziphus jujuba var. spinosa]
MLNDQRASTSYGQYDDHDHDHDDNHQEGGNDEQIRDIHALTPPHPPPPRRRREIWETGSHRSSTSMASEGGNSENFTTMSREFSALVLAGSTIGNNGTNTTIDNDSSVNTGNNLGMIGEDEATEEETNPLAIVPDNNPLDPVASPRRRAMAAARGSSHTSSSTTMTGGGGGHQGDQVVSVQRVKKEEVESKISAWQNAKISKINNRFKRDDAVINGWESEEVQKATSWMKKVERKLEEKRARALEKMQNQVAKAHRKAEEKRASAEAKRGTKVARVLEIANLMRAVGRAPAKRSFF